MKILYSIQATGNGHISRAIQLLPALKKYASIDILLSGKNSHLQLPMPVTYRSGGVSLFYDNHGGLSYSKILTKNAWLKSYKEALSLPVDKYDLIINDFEPITAHACKLKSKTSVQLSHQASFLFSQTPRPSNKDVIGEWVLKNYSYSSTALGFHFRPYNENIFSPVIKNEILQADVVDKGHITVYLSGFTKEYYLRQFLSIPETVFHCFVAGQRQIERINNILFFPIDYKAFNTSMIECHGVITGGGFETPAEALYLKKKLISIPIKSHYEQACNAAALSKMGILTLHGNQVNKLNSYIIPWLNSNQTLPIIENCSVEQVVEKVLNLAA